ncbi:MAG: hypothetical protein NXI22_08505 [bacterium]|nr:hypothetical protein [bacterium]
MAKQTKYQQCTMQRSVDQGTMQMTSYIPHSHAKVGGVLKLRDESGCWTNGWVVKLVGETMIDGDSVPDHRKAIRNHRKQTGDNMPRREG